MKTKIALLALVFATPVAAHDHYTDWKIPGTQTSCCNNEDCHPTRAYLHEDGRWRALHKGEWLIVPKDRVLQEDKAGDGRSHICASPVGYVFYFSAGQVRG